MSALASDRRLGPSSGKQPHDLPVYFKKRGILRMTRTGNTDLQRLDDLRGLVSEYDHPIGKESRLQDVVRDQQPGRGRLPPKALQ